MTQYTYAVVARASLGALEKGLRLTASLATGAGRALSGALTGGAKASAAALGTLARASASLLTGGLGALFTAVQTGVGLVRDLGLAYMAFGDKLKPTGDTAGRVGDLLQKVAEVARTVLLPLMTELFTRIDEVVNRVLDWSQANAQLIEDRVIQGLQWIAESAIPAIATGAGLAAKAVLGIQVAWIAVRGAVQEFAGAFLATSATVLSASADLAARVGQGGVAESLRDAAKAAEEMAKPMEGSWSEASLAVLEVDKQIQGIDAALEALAGSGSESVQRLAQAVQGKLATAIRSARASASGSGGGADAAATAAAAETARKVAEMRLGFIQRGNAAEMQALEERYAYQAALEQRQAAEAEAAAQASASRMQALAEAAMATAQAAAGHISTVFGGVVGAIRDGADAGKALLQGLAAVGQQVIQQVVQQQLAAMATTQAATVATATTEVTAKAASAAAGAASSVAGIPIAGPALAVAAMGAILATVLGLLSGFNSGGIVTGGSPLNQDSVPALLTRGEAVIDRETTQRLAAILGGSGGGGRAASRASASSPSTSAASAGRSSPSITIQTLALPESRIAVTQLGRRLGRALRES